MPAYLIMNFTIEDQAAFADYNEGATKAFNIGVPFEMIIGDSATENLEGETGAVTAVFKFQSKEDARKIYDSKLYQELIPKRLATTSRHFAILTDGLS